MNTEKVKRYGINYNGDGDLEERADGGLVRYESYAILEAEVKAWKARFDVMRACEDEKRRLELAVIEAARNSTHSFWDSPQWRSIWEANNKKLLDALKALDAGGGA